MKTFTLIIAIFFSTFCYGISGNSEARDSEIKLHSKSAARDILTLDEIEKKIITLNKNDREFTVFSASGFVNSKIVEWGQEQIKEGKNTPKQIQYIYSIALSRLALLAQKADFIVASMCHTESSLAVMKISQGKPANSPNCIKDVYTSEIQSRFIGRAYTPEIKAIEELANKWATEAIMFAIDGSLIDNFGTETNRIISKSSPKKDVFSLDGQYSMSDENGKLAICSPILSKASTLIYLSLDNRIRKEGAINPDLYKSFYQITVKAEMLDQLAKVLNMAAYKKAWDDSANDKSLKVDERFRVLTNNCMLTVDKVKNEGKINSEIENIAIKKATDLINELKQVSKAK